MFPLFEDYTIENFCRYLTQMGIGAELAKESRPPTVVYIDVAKGPISRINISIDSYEGAQGAEIEHCIDYVVPDFRMTKEFPDIHLAVAYTRKGFLWGKRVVDIRWDGNDFGLGVKDFLNRDESLKAQIMEASADNLQIKSNIKAKSWIITTGRGYGASWPRSLAGKPLAGFCATRSRRIQDLYGMVVHVIRCNTHCAIDNRR